MMPGDPVVGSTILRRPAIQSPGYQAGVKGWTVNADDSAEFNNLMIRGTFNGNNFILNSSGLFIYSGAPAFGNLIESHAPAAGTDSFGNAYLIDSTCYQSGATFLATNISSATITWYSAPGAGGPWTAGAAIQSSIVGGSNLFLLAGNQTALGFSGACAWLDGVQNFILPPGGGPFISGESFHSVSLNANLTGRLRVKKLPWNAIWIDCQVATTAAATAYGCGNLPDASYYPNTTLTLPLGNTGAVNSRLVIPASGGLNIAQGAATSGVSMGWSGMYPTN